MQRYRIPFVGLKTGKHEFEFDINKDFFDAFEYSIVKDGNLKAHVVLDKQDNILQLSFHIYGSIGLTCDVCLADFMGKTDIKEHLIVHFGDEEMGESTEEIMVLPRNEHELKLANTIYEYINLSVPHYAKCDIQGEGISCDDSMVEKLKSLSAEDESEQSKTDPRWDILKNIKNN